MAKNSNDVRVYTSELFPWDFCIQNFIRILSVLAVKYGAQNCISPFVLWRLLNGIAMLHLVKLENLGNKKRIRSFLLKLTPKKRFERGFIVAVFKILPWCGRVCWKVTALGCVCYGVRRKTSCYMWRLTKLVMRWRVTLVIQFRWLNSVLLIKKFCSHLSGPQRVISLYLFLCRVWSRKKSQTYQHFSVFSYRYLSEIIFFLTRKHWINIAKGIIQSIAQNSFHYVNRV
jgi:hypothetical protein